MRILNLFAGIGGNRTLWGDSHEITAVEINQQIALVYHKRFPKDKIIIGNAYKYCLLHYDEFDFIMAGPPCPTHSWANNWLHVQGCRRYPDSNLWELIVWLKHHCKNKIKWCVENVKPYYEIFLKPSFIIGRHYFWSNINIPDNKFEFSKISIINAKSSHRRDNQQYYQDLCDHHLINKRLIDLLQDKRWKNHDMKGQVLRNCLKPEIGKYILDHIKIKKQLKII